MLLILEKGLTNLLNLNAAREGTYTKLKPVGSKLEVLSGSAKVY